jgi:hypothetical protein
MKLKSIMYALGYGKSRKVLVRSEGARRVKQAEKAMNLRQVQKNLSFIDRYGSSGYFCNTPTLTKEQAVQLRSKWLQESIGNVVGIQTLEVDFSEIEGRIQDWVSGRMAGKGDL